MTMTEQLTLLQHKVDTLFDAIKHGDRQHQDWLSEKISQHFATAPSLPHTGEAVAWRHKKRGSVYTEIGRATLQMSGSVLTDDDQMVVYRGADGRLWARLESEFEDGRFEPANLPIQGEGN